MLWKWPTCPTWFWSVTSAQHAFNLSHRILEMYFLSFLLSYLLSFLLSFFLSFTLVFIFVCRSLIYLNLTRMLGSSIERKIFIPFFFLWILENNYYYLKKKSWFNWYNFMEKLSYSCNVNCSSNVYWEERVENPFTTLISVAGQEGSTQMTLTNVSCSGCGTPCGLKIVTITIPFSLSSFLSSHIIFTKKKI